MNGLKSNKCKKTKAGFFLAFFAIFCFAMVLSPQQILAQYADTIPLNDSLKTTETSSILLPKRHSPQKAMLMSTLLPGLGQAYNEQYLKIPVIYVSAAVVTYFAVTNYKGSQKFMNEYKYRVNGETDKYDPKYLSYPNKNILNLYYSYRQSFELSLIIGGALYVLNIIDAYVYGHLFKFELSDNLSLQVTPTVNYQYLGFQNRALSPEYGLRLNFLFK